TTITVNNRKNNISNMPLFKSSSYKQQTSSAVASPSQTPRTSMQEQRRVPHLKLTQQQALEYLMSKTIGDAAAGSYVR
ncbi:hypothetical protein BGZ82_005264, partial [Podila clonocystis]